MRALTNGLRILLALAALPLFSLTSRANRAVDARPFDGARLRTILDASKHPTIARRVFDAQSLPEANIHQIQALDAVDSVRDALGLGHVRMDPRLNAVADAHARYLDANAAYGHFEHSSKPGFVGQTPQDRLDYFGWTLGHYENVSTGLTSPKQSVAGLFDAPYHRIPFMQPGPISVGSGFRGDSFALEFTTTGSTATVVSPANGQRNVPTTWDGNEDPNPLRMSGLRGKSGYPIVFAHFAPGLQRIRVASASLTARGQSVPFVLDTPANDDHLTNAAILIPKRPLISGSQYQATIQTLTDTGTPIARTWTFTTR